MPTATEAKTRSSSPSAPIAAPLQAASSRDVVFENGLHVWSTFDSGNLENIRLLDDINDAFSNNNSTGDNDGKNDSEDDDNDGASNDDESSLPTRSHRGADNHQPPNVSLSDVSDELIICGSVRPDPQGKWKQKEMKTWFYFKVASIPASTRRLRFCILNMNKQLRLYNQGLEPVVCRLNSPKLKPTWGRYCSSVEADFDEGLFTLQFTYEVTSEHTQETILGFAFCYPYAYEELQAQLDTWESKYAKDEGDYCNGDVYFHRETVANSVQGRSVDLVTITAWQKQGDECKEREQRIKTLFPLNRAGAQQRPFAFPEKKVYFVSARVHPGETPGSHVCNGVLKFILNEKDPRARRLREKFLFKIMPMLNPDGVAMGNYRCDSQGLNLNRFYNNPSPQAHPSIYASKLLTYAYASSHRLAYYIDTHGHATKRGCFFYGNCLEAGRHIDNVLFSKLVELNSPHLDFMACNFSEKNMFSKDKRDGLSKEGSGRVGTFYGTDITHCYTLECNYNTGRMVNQLPPCHPPASYIESYPATSEVLPYSPESWENVGRAMVVAALDISEDNPHSRVPLSEHESLIALRAWVKAHIKTSTKFKSASQACRGKISARKRNLKPHFEELASTLASSKAPLKGHPAAPRPKRRESPLSARKPKGRDVRRDSGRKDRLSSPLQSRRKPPTHPGRNTLQDEKMNANCPKKDVDAKANYVRSSQGRNQSNSLRTIRSLVHSSTTAPTPQAPPSTTTAQRTQGEQATVTTTHNQYPLGAHMQMAQGHSDALSTPILSPSSGRRKMGNQHTLPRSTAQPLLISGLRRNEGAVDHGSEWPQSTAVRRLSRRNHSPQGRRLDAPRHQHMHKHKQRSVQQNAHSTHAYPGTSATRSFEAYGKQKTAQQQFDSLQRSQLRTPAERPVPNSRTTG